MKMKVDKRCMVDTNVLIHSTVSSSPWHHEARNWLAELVDKGVYAEGHGGGQTEDTGNFTFAANRAYWIENGEIKFPLKSVVVRGHILDFLKNVIGASKEVIVKTSILGGCGKGGQAPLPVGLGGPYLAVKEAIISFGR